MQTRRVPTTVDSFCIAVLNNKIATNLLRIHIFQKHVLEKAFSVHIEIFNQLTVSKYFKKRRPKLYQNLWLMLIQNGGL